MTNQNNHLLYIALVDLSTCKGYTSKLFGQIQGLRALGFTPSLLAFDSGYISLSSSSDHHKNSSCPRVFRRFFFYKSALRYLQNFRPRFLYQRYVLLDPFHFIFLILIKILVPDTSVIVEIPTYPYDFIPEYRSSFFRLILLYSDKFFRRFLRFFVDFVTSPTDFPLVFRVPNIQISNGISPRIGVAPNYVPPNPHNTLNLVFTGYLARQHGLDRIVNSIHHYYSNTSNPTPIRLSIASPDTSELTSIKSLVDKLSLSKSVHFLGFLQPDSLESLYSKSHFGISSLGWHRVSVLHASNLKAREYTQFGLPTILVNNDCALFDLPFSFFLPANESLIDFSKLLHHSHSIYLTPAIVRHELTNYAAMNLNWSKTMSNLSGIL